MRGGVYKRGYSCHSADSTPAIRGSPFPRLGSPPAFALGAGWTIAASGSYRFLFFFGGTATLAALVPLAFAPSPVREQI